MSEIPEPMPGSNDLDSVFVFTGRRLREGAELADTARFGDDLWPLAPAALQGQDVA